MSCPTFTEVVRHCRTAKKRGYKIVCPVMYVLFYLNGSGEELQDGKEEVV